MKIDSDLMTVWILLIGVGALLLFVGIVAEPNIILKIFFVCGGLLLWSYPIRYFFERWKEDKKP